MNESATLWKISGLGRGDQETTMQWFFSTNQSGVLLFQRIVLGLVMFPHGAQKLFGWFGGGGWTDTMGYLTGAVGLPYAIAALVIISEVFGSIGLIVGLGTRLAALGVVAVMVGAMLSNHLWVGFFMNWGGRQGGEGFEYHLLALALALPLIVKGGGWLSADAAI